MELFINTLYLGSGGFLGTVGRYWVSTIVARSLGESFWGTMSVNYAGSFFIGLIAILLSHPNASHPGFRLFFIVGLMGGFTTYSSFSYDIFHLIVQGRITYVFSYVALTLFGGLLLTYMGVLSGNWLLKQVVMD